MANIIVPSNVKDEPASLAGASWILAVVKGAVASWGRHNDARLAAALAYYALFSFAPLLIIVIEAAALIVGHGHAQGHHSAGRDAILNGLNHSVGKGGAQAIGAIVDATLSQKHAGFWASLLSWVVLIFAAGGLFGALRDAIDTVWDVEPPKGLSWGARFRRQFTSFALIAGISLILVLSLSVDTILSAFFAYLSHALPELVPILGIGSVIVSFATLLVLFAVMFKVLPSAAVQWRDVTTGAAMTALLFTLGQIALGFYLSHFASTSVYGAAGSLVIVLLWLYYSSQIILFGAEFTKAYADRVGSRSSEAAKETADA